MNRLLFILVTGLLLFSCKENYEPRELDSVSIIEFTVDSSSIRAIQVINDSTIFYAGSRGDIGHK